MEFHTILQGVELHISASIINKSDSLQNDYISFTNPLYSSWRIYPLKITRSCGKKMRGIPSKVEVVVGSPLPIYRIEILKELIRKAALRKLADMSKSVRVAA
jgi:hypothetical protein